MNLRLLEVIVPASSAESVLRLLGDQRLLADWFGVWTQPLEGGLVQVRLLLAADRTEEVTDRLSDRFGTAENFRILLLPVEATLPAPAEEEAGEDKEKGGEASSRPGRISREELYADVTEGAAVSPVYLVLTALSAVVAAAGLMRDDVAAVIGAMVIAPLLRPNVALALAVTLGDLKLAARSLWAGAAGVLLVVALAGAIGLLFGVDPEGAQVAARSEVALGDFALALAAGSAGVLSFTTGVPAAVIGVMVAVALLPPLAAAGLLTFLAQGVRPRHRAGAKNASRAAWTALTFWAVLLAVFVLLVLRWWRQ